MNTIISNKIFVKSASLDLWYWCRDNLVVTNPKWATLKKLGKEEDIIRYHIEPKMYLYVENGLDLVLPFGCLQAIWKFIKDSPVETKFNQDIPMLESVKKSVITKPLFDYQELALKTLFNARGGILEAAAGSGKTNIGIALSHKIGLNTLWLCHTKDLLVQTKNRIKELFPNMPIGTITGGKVNMVNNGITISTIQTLANIDYDIYANNFNVVITDECHHVNSSPTLLKQFGKVIEKIPARYKFGLTATPDRQDGLIKTMYATVGCNLKGEFEPVFKIEKSKTNTLFATHTRLDMPTPPDVDMVKSDGTFDYSKLLDYLSESEIRNNTIVDKIQEMAQFGRKQLVLCSRVNNCEIIHQKLLEKGLKSVLLVGKVTDKQRKAILNREVEWDIIVGTFSLAKEGLDVTILDTLYICSPIKDKAATIQSVGRIERVCEGKNEPIVFDCVDKYIPYCLGAWKKRVGFLKKRR